MVAVSIIEGFCLPIIEAFGFNAPVVTSDLNPMLEIAAGAALIVDPYDIGSLQNAMIEIAQNKAVAELLRAKGQQRYRDFSARSIADKLRPIYGPIGGYRTTKSANIMPRSPV